MILNAECRIATLIIRDHGGPLVAGVSARGRIRVTGRRPDLVDLGEGSPASNLSKQGTPHPNRVRSRGPSPKSGPSMVYPQAPLRWSRREHLLWTTVWVASRANTVDGMVTGLADRLRLSSWVRAVSWHRRLLAAAAAATAVIFILEALEPPAPPTVPVLVADRDLAGGSALGPDEVRIVRRPAEMVPSGAITNQQSVIGRLLAGPVREGELITNVRMIGPPLVDGFPGRVVAPVRLSDLGVAQLLRMGDRVDVLAAPTAPDGSTVAEVVASNVQVVAVPEPQDGDTVTSGALVVFAATPGDAQALAGAAVTSQLTVTLLPAKTQQSPG
jgi:pilus assembly protein CpaB